MKIGMVVCVDEVIEKTQMFGVRYMPVWAFTLSSYLKEIPGLETFLWDTRIIPKFSTPEADVFLISGINQDFDSLLAYQRYLKSTYPTAIQVLGGPIVSSFKMAGRINDLKDFDHVFLGDGEEAIRQLVENFREKVPMPWLLENHEKFKLMDARPMDFDLISKTADAYYGAVIEVSRGCPFLCEFCDIRTKPDNNRADNKKIEVILEEIQGFYKLGVTNFLMACDNFIGSVTWAEQLCDAIIDWKKTTGATPRFYTWLTINVAYLPQLLKKLKLAGFDMFFIGIESFGMEQLLETAKLQNAKADMKECIQTIQSAGFIIVAGLIFGFDTDPENVVDQALEGIRTSGLISGDPSLLTALPGTPLYRRMELSGRLRKGKLGLGGKKYATNILYVQDREKLIKDFIRFVHIFNSPAYQYSRFHSFLGSLKADLHDESSKANGSYISPATLFKLVAKNPQSLLSLIKRVFGVVSTPQKIYYVLRALVLTKRTPAARMSHFYFWLFNWSNSVLKYDDLKPQDFDIDSLGRMAQLKDVLPEGYETDYFEPIPHSKIKSQRQATIKALSNVYELSV